MTSVDIKNAAELWPNFTNYHPKCAASKVFSKEQINDQQPKSKAPDIT